MRSLLIMGNPYQHAPEVSIARTATCSCLKLARLLAQENFCLLACAACYPPPMPLSWNEIRHRAIAFSREWQGETREAAERQSFWNDFFNVFGVRRRTVATFEEPVRKLSGDWGIIDLFWPGRLLAEHKSAGEDLGKTHAQGMASTRYNGGC